MVADIGAVTTAPIALPDDDAKADEKDKAKKPILYRYWTASIVDDTVVPGIGLTYSQAMEWVAEEKNLLCIDHAAAIAIVKFFPSAIHDVAHQPGYLNHYHLSSAHKSHIWYYGI